MYRKFFKRFFDITLSGLALIILSPIIFVTWLFVLIFLGYPAVFVQVRPGKNNKLFKFYKFRSMSNKKDKNGELLPDKDRITKFGKLLRKTSLDELPQLWNIFIGNMSIVGPRPKLVKDMVFFDEKQNIRAHVRPGLTGYAQANGRNLNSWAETFEYDLYYVEHVSLWLDIKIIFKTIGKVFSRKEITDTDKTADEYYYGDHLLVNEKISKSEYDEKNIQAKQLILEMGKKQTKVNIKKTDIAK